MKKPTADLEDNKPALPDEVALGVTYDQIDDYLEGKEVSADVKWQKLRTGLLKPNINAIWQLLYLTISGNRRLFK